jgi:hypothetical protein
MPRARRAAVVFCAAIVITAFISAAGASLAAHAGAAATTVTAAVTQDADIPADVGLHTVEDQIAMAGATGFLHLYNGSSQYLWTDYATGTTVPVPALAQASFSPAGGDSVFIRGAINTADDLTMLDLATMTAQKWSFPTGYAELAEGGDSALAFTKSGGVGSWHVLAFGQDGTAASDTTVSGPPADAVLGVSQHGPADAAGMIVRWNIGAIGGPNEYGLLNLADATVMPIPGATGQPIALTTDRVVFYDSATEQVSVYSRAGLLDGSTTAAQTVTLPGASGYDEVALAGDHVLAVPATSCLSCGYTIGPVLDVPLSGAASGQPLPQAQTGPGGSIAQAPDDSVLAVGGTGPADWSVRRLAVDASDTVTNAPMLTLTGPLANAGLTITNGLVQHIEAYAAPDGTTRYQLFNHPLVVTGGPALDGGVLASPLPCGTGAACVLAFGNDGYGTSYLSSQTAGAVTLREQFGASISSLSVTLPSASGTIVDASPEYVIVDGVNPARQYLAEPNYERVDSSGPVTGAALWFDTLWRADGAGLLQATDLDTGVASKPVPTGANCAASEIQATQRWLYWSCGRSGPAGVYDQQAKVHFAVPAGPMLLGDGYLVQRDSVTGDLVMYDVHADAVAEPVTLASNVPGGPAASSSASADPVADGRGITWAVDKHSGDVAYVAADDSVHVVNAAVPAAPPVIVAPTAAQLVAVPGFSPSKNGGWTQWVTLSRPVTSWTLTFRKAGTGAVVHTESGGATIEPFLSWNGYLPNGTVAYSGTYDWSLSVTTPGSTTPVTVPGSTQVVECGQIPFRSYDCDGASALLAVNGPGGYSHWYNGTANGGLSDNGATDDWSLCSGGLCDTAIVPFGDINGDGRADLLVRTGNGQLRAYLGIGQSYFNPGGGIKSISLGSGWNSYNALVYAGDLNRDGHPDLVARDSAGRLWLFASTGTGRFHTRALIGSGWGGYVKLIGAGDLTGDGVGDLLAIDKAGVMWLFVGNGHGGFLPTRYKVGYGWSAYNAVIGVGDLSGDGCNDVVARDTHGTLWRFNGNCKGGLAKPVTISTGWQKYKGLF